MIHVLARGNDYELITPYDQGFVSSLKTLIPFSERRYNAVNRSWLIAGKHGATIQMLIQTWFGQRTTLPTLAPCTPIMKVLEVLYLGRAKTRADGTVSASGWVDGGWNVLFDASVLRGWFEPNFAPERPTAETLYSLLGIQGGASADEVRSGYRRIVKQWHPDVCREADALTVFHQIQHAWEVLSNPKARGRYDAGLALETTLGKRELPEKTALEAEYRAPFRSGLILADYTEQVGQKVVSKIHAWQDITNEAGQTLVSSWTMGEDAPRLEWA